MPSETAVIPRSEAMRDPILAQALVLLRRRIDNYRSFVAAARERIRTLLTTTGAERARLELGSFGRRIDAARFAELRHGVALDSLSRSRLERAAAVLAELESLGDALFVADVPSGDSLRVVAAHALARAGRGFAAAAVAELVRSGHYEPERHDRLLDGYPFEWWSKSEREHAPPLIVGVDGADLRAGALADLLDGAQQLVLLVHGPSTPAPLVRLTTPGTLVIQGKELAGLKPLAEFGGPAVAALFGHEAALFTHYPIAGSAIWQRVVVTHRPEPPKKRVGGASPRQQLEELLQLDALVEHRALPDSPVDALVPIGPGEATDRLTAWLLAESGLVSKS
jgi:hypothetical protein